MLLALPIIAVVVASYIQFAFIRHDGFGLFRPLVWDALEDLKGIMRRRMPFWMQPISAGILKLTLPAPIPAGGLSVVPSNQTLSVVPPLEGLKSYFNSPPFGIPAWIFLRSQGIQKTYLFIVFCGAVTFLSLEGIYALWTLLMAPTLESTTCDHQRKPKPEDTMYSVAHPSVSTTRTLDSVSELISPHPSATGPHDSAPGAADVSGPINPRLPTALTIPELRLEPLVLSSTLLPATTSQPVWEELRVSSIESPNQMDVDLSRYWHREVMIVEGVPFITNQPRTAPRSNGQQNAIGSGLSSTGLSRTDRPDSGIIYSTPGRISSSPEEPSNLQTPSIPRITVEEYQEPSEASTMDCYTCVENPAKCPLETRSFRDVSTAHDLAMDVSVEGSLGISGSTFGESGPTLGGLAVSLCANVSNIRDPSGDPTRCVIPGTEHSETPLGGTPKMLRIPVNLCDHEGNLVSASATSAPWVGFAASKNSLVHTPSGPATRNTASGATYGATPPETQDSNDLSLVNHLDHNNAWINHSVNDLEALTGIDGTGDGSGEDNSYIHSECIGHLRTSFNSSPSIGWISQRSASTHLDTSLITPSNSLPSTVQLDEPSYPEVPPKDVASTMDFLFERQLSQTSSLPSPTQRGYSLENTNPLDSFAEVQPSGLWSMNPGAAPDSNLCSETQMLHSFLDDRTYAEVAGVPSDIESARATLSLSRWRIPRSGPERSQPDRPSTTRSGRGVSDVGIGNWAVHGTASSMWARPPDTNSRGFGTRRGRAWRAQNVRSAQETDCV